MGYRKRFLYFFFLTLSFGKNKDFKHPERYEDKRRERKQENALLVCFLVCFLVFLSNQLFFLLLL